MDDDARAVRATIMTVLDRQIKGIGENGEPIDTSYVRDTFIRLRAAHGDAEARRRMAVVLVEEIFFITQKHQNFSKKRYKKALDALS